MPNRTKRQSKQHVIGRQGVKILCSRLPPWWITREYQPDYGIDLAIELFEAAKEATSGKNKYDTLGEHLFIQVKGAERLHARKITVTARGNVERGLGNERLATAPETRTLSVFPYSIATSELLTIQRMSASLPVLLVLVDVSARRCFFLCLTDYIDKIILPEDPLYADKGSKTIYVPERNEILEDLTALHYYAKRPKLYAAFQKFAYQEHELGFVGSQELVAAARRFAHILLRYDFWQSCGWWAPIAGAHRGLQSFVNGESPHMFDSGKMSADPNPNQRVWSEVSGDGSLHTAAEMYLLMDIRAFWQNLANIGRVHEELCREWFLPTMLGLITS